ncbi:site-specific DNA-methyltransferase [Vibrio metschnikovii]|uniref:site-specific DNA-methyltransferase n=1 Tax=Vibrio metschnikovii TaxID=28172 RepID=UPI001C2F323C|nr:site-specific DNA-methyltransferase [Vibrio metschnikovii]
MPTLNWIGKAAVEKHHKEVPFRLLEPVSELSCGDPDSGNLIVQGDNLHALKALLPRYAGQVKCIYIDPPYNTGNEGWVYNDNVNSPEIRKWLGEVVGKEGETLDRHDRWLCMMYPRLLLLKQFLHDEGMIFVSIADDEMHHLRILLDEIFGTNNRVASFVWRTDGNFDNQAKVKVCHEYVLCYARNISKLPHPKVIDPSTEEGSKLFNKYIRNTIVKNGPKNPVSSVFLPQGFPADFQEGEVHIKSNWPKYSSSIKVKNGKIIEAVEAESGWSSKNLLLKFIETDFNPVIDTKGQKTRFVVTSTGAIESIKERENASHVISVLSGVGSTQSQSATLKEMGFEFSFPKPVDLISYLISIHPDKELIVLDSFAGSGSTAESTLRQNTIDGGSRRFILIEMDENIAQNITRDRVGKVINGYSTKKGARIHGLNAGFQFNKLSEEPLFNSDGPIRSDVNFEQLAEFVWFMETGAGLSSSNMTPKEKHTTPYLGKYKDRAIFLLYNGILKDKTDIGGNVLNNRSLEELEAALPNFSGPKVVYGARSRFDKTKLAKLGITFHQLPYELAVKTWF